MTKFGTKNVLLGHFWARISKNFLYIWNWHPPIYECAAFWETMKTLNFGLKMSFLGALGLKF